MSTSFGSHTSLNGWLIVIDAFRSSMRTSHAAGKKVEVHVVERVLHDLMRLGVDPDRHQRDLVHQPLHRGFHVFATIRFLLFLPFPLLFLLVPEEARRVVLDAERLGALNGFAADQGVLALLELEAEEIGGVDEQSAGASASGTLPCWLADPRARSAWQRLTGGGGGVRDRLTTRLSRSFIRRRNESSYLRRSPSETSTPFALTGLRMKYPSWMNQLYLALLAPHREVGRPADFYPLVLIEDVLLQLFPILVAAREHPLHEGVQVALRTQWDGCRQEGEPGADEAGGQGCRDTGRHVGTLRGRRRDR